MIGNNNNNDRNNENDDKNDRYEKSLVFINVEVVLQK